MVTIIDYKERMMPDGTFYYLLELQGGVEMAKSKETGRFYATAKTATISSTFDEQTCKGLIGTEMPGSVKKENCAPYKYTVKDTGEEIELSHRWVYSPEKTFTSKPKKEAASDIADESVFSKNGRSLEMA